MIGITQWDQKTITIPGIYAGVPLDRYHSSDICDGPSISSSGLRTIFSESPAHYFVDSPYNPDREPEDDNAQSAALILGRAAHHLFLGQPNFRKEFVVRPETLHGDKWNGNRTVCREWLKEAKRAHLTVLTPEQGKAVLGMSKILHAEPLIENGILRGKIEHSMFARDPKTGIWLKVRPDAIPTDAHDYADFKTTRSVHEDALQRTIGEYGYHAQGAMIGTVARMIGLDMQSFTLVFQESRAPYSVRIVAIKESDLKRGETENRIALRYFARCMKTGDWPGPAGHQKDVQWLGLTKWEEDRRDYRIKQIEAELKD